MTEQANCGISTQWIHFRLSFLQWVRKKYSLALFCISLVVNGAQHLSQAYFVHVLQFLWGKVPLTPLPITDFYPFVPKTE